MKKFIAIALYAISISGMAGATPRTPVGVTYDAHILRANDGDTVVVEALWIPDPLKKEISVRIFGVDTPEKGGRAQCPAEDELGQAATAFTRNLIAQATREQYVLYSWDKFGGRVLGDIILDGQSLREQLIANGFARPYFGEAKQSWCN